MFESIISFFAETNVVGVAVFSVLFSLHYITIPFWVGAVAKKINDLFNGNTTRKQLLIRGVCAIALILTTGVLPYALLWAFTNFATVTVAFVLMFVLDQAVTRVMHLRGVHFTVFTVN